MDKGIAEKIVNTNLGDDNGVEVRLYENYSGRGMFGQATTAIVVTSLPKLIMALSVTCLQMGFEEDEELNELLIKTIDGIRTDNLGRDIIAY